MSFTQYREFVSEGDTVVIFIGYQNLLTFTVNASKVHQTKYGALPHKNLIGMRYGSKINCSRGYCYLLHATPELWTVTLPHRTQILYTTDISFVIFQLDIKPGSIVIEAGTGSGSLSHAIMKSIFPTGHLHTFDFHEDRANAAREEFRRHDCSSVVTVQHRDVCRDGFGLSDMANAVFLDLPVPWEALKFAKSAIKQEGGRICTFSPCIEQVQKTCEYMRELDFVDIQVSECLLRTYEVREVAMPSIDLSGANVTAKSSRNCEQTDKKQRRDADQIDEHASSDSCTVNAARATSSVEQQQQRNSAKRTVDFVTSLPPRQMPGHTGFLVFATKSPQSSQN